MTLAEELATYAHDLSPGDLSTAAESVLTERLVDSLACAYAARGERPVEQLLDYTTGLDLAPDSGTAAIITTNETTSIDRATLATGALIRYLDWNDTYLSAEPAHPSDNFGAILPVAAAHERSGQDLLLAAALAYEVQCRLCDAASLRANGFDHVNYGLVSSALAAGKLAGLNREALTEAVNIALNGHVALRQARAGELTEWKGFAFANAARNAVVATELAANGIDGPAPIFEGEFGVFEQLTGPFELDCDSWGGRDGNWMAPQTYIKRYPVEYHAQAAVDLALDITARHELDWHDIERIENETYEAAVSIIGEEPQKWDPQTRETADHSMPYCIARALIDGEITLSQFTAEKVRDDDVRTLMDAMTVDENPDYTDAYGDAFPHRLRIECSDGRTIDRELQHPPGHPANPLDRSALEAKFHEAAGDRLDSDVQERVLEDAWRIADLDDVSTAIADW